MNADESPKKRPDQDSPPPSSPPPRGPRLRTILAFLIVGLVMLVAGALWGGYLKAGLGRVYRALGGRVETASVAQAQWYTCSMHSFVLLPKPGQCPICHMDLVPREQVEFKGEVAISPLVTQNIGVRLAPVVTGPVTRLIRTVGTVDYNEPAVRDVNIKISGWIEKLFVDSTGQPVKKGQDLFSIYSPELFTAQEEYLQAYRNRPAAPPSTSPAGSPSETARWDAELLAAARKRLEYFDISQEQISELERTGKSSKTMVLRSPHSGLVVIKNVYEGMKVDSGMQLYRIADLSKVWVMVTLYEYQLPYVQVGQDALMTLPYVPGQKFQGKITYVYPVLNQELRQVKMRVEVDNPYLQLKPGMFVNVEIHSTAAKDKTLVPREAVMDTGQRQVALVSLGEGRFQPRTVQVGVEADGGMVEILDGLKPGEMVVVSGQFLIDSEARYQEAMAKMVKGGLVGEQKAVAAVSGESQIKSLPPEAAKSIADALDGYFQIGAKLAADDAADLAPPARKVAAGVEALIKVEIPDDPHFWHRHTEVADIRGKALELTKPAKLPDARETFADLSVAMGKLLRATGVPPSFGKEIHQLHCPMYREGQGGNIWLQPAGEVRNPFFGKGPMLGCFDKRVSLPVTGAKAPETQPMTPDGKPSPSPPGIP